MSLPISIPNTFANANAAIPLSQLDNNFTTVSGAINGIGNGAESLANVSITGGAAANVLLQNRNREFVTIEANGAANTIDYDVNDATSASVPGQCHCERYAQPSRQLLGHA
jgi:hypothetical protein